jgi:hypothetical protein
LFNHTLYQNDEIHNCHIIIPQTYVHIRNTTHNKVLINVSTLLLTWFSNIKYRGFFYCAQFCRCQACVNDYGQHPNIDYMNCNLTYMTMNAAVTNIWHTPMDVDCVNQTWLHLIKLKYNLCFIWFILCIRHIMERGFFFEVASKGINLSILF